MTLPPIHRATAVAGAAAVLAASVAASAAQRTRPTSNFISELGVPGPRLARTFRAGEAAAALACLSVGVHAVRRRPAQGPAAGETGDPARGPAGPVGGVLRMVTRHTGGELRGLALGASGACLLLSAALPSSPGCPVPVLDGRVPGRDWVHVPGATAAFYLWPLAAGGWLRWLLALNLLVLAPPTMLRPHGSATAVLQRTMTALAAATLATWSPTTPARRAAHVDRWGR